MTELEYYDEKAERHLDANGFNDREWMGVKIVTTALVLLIVGIAVWGIWG